MEHQAILVLLKNILKLCQAGPPLKVWKKKIISKPGKLSDRVVLGPFGEAVAPIEAPAKPVSDGPVPRVR